jgi:hypothetical protein
MEERRTAELLSDFDDYEIGDSDGDESHSDDEDEPQSEENGADKGARKKKKGR